MSKTTINTVETHRLEASDVAPINEIKQMLAAGEDVKVILAGKYTSIEVIWHLRDVLVTPETAMDILLSCIAIDINYDDTLNKFIYIADKKNINQNLSQYVLDTGFVDMRQLERELEDDFEGSLRMPLEMWDPLLAHGFSPNVLLIISLTNYRETWGESANGPWHERVMPNNYLFDLAMKLGANVNYMHEDGYSILDLAVINGNIIFVDKILAMEGLNKTLSLSLYLKALDGNSFKYITELQQRFPEMLKADETYELARSYGMSHNKIHQLLDVCNLADDFRNYKYGKDANISNIELSILDDTLPQQDLATYKNAVMQNQYGFPPLQLALIAGRWELAYDMIKAGFALTEVNNNGCTAQMLLNRLIYQCKDRNLYLAIREESFNKLDDIDIVSDNGESLVDTFLGNSELFEQAIAKTRDPLYLFYKKDANMAPYNGFADKTHIAISQADEFWSTGVNTVARLIMRNHPDVEFHMVTNDMLDKGGDAFIKQFNGWINPGAGDSYPRGVKEFNKNEWQPTISTEKIYQFMLNKTLEFNIPIVGMCAGAQNFALYHDGYLYQLSGYSHGKHTVTFLEGTLAHYHAMTAAQQAQALKTCEFPQIQFKGDTAHFYAAVKGKLGFGIELGAVSEDDVPMAYAHNNGIRLATQFHPEHYYGFNFEGAYNHQRIWLENFVKLAVMHHDYMHNNGTHPLEYMANVKEQLETCVIDQICVNDAHAWL